MQAVGRASCLQDRLRRSGAALSAARQEATAARLARQQAEAAAAGMRRLVEELYSARASGQLGQALQVRRAEGPGRGTACWRQTRCDGKVGEVTPEAGLAG